MLNDNVDLHILSLPDRRGTWLDQAVASAEAQPCRVTVWPVEAGSSTGRNRAMALGAASAEYVCYLDDDDYLLPGSLEACMDALSNDPTAVGAFTDEFIMGDDGSSKPGPATGTGEWNPLTQLMVPRYGRHLAVMRRSVVQPHLSVMACFETLSEYVLRGLITQSGHWIHCPFDGYVTRDHAGARSSRRATPQIRSAAIQLIAPALTSHSRNLQIRRQAFV